MVLGDTIYDSLREIIFLKKLDSELDVTTLFIRNDLADVMEETTEPNNIDISFEFSGQIHPNTRFFQGMSQHILTVG
ncbi:MAG: hypothetical protein UX21_C0037G0003 [Microgenomates group bacterium GW2011_GWC2_45_8]|nr:MAG: hypothetical protein UX21_C0037G0003 [Microgenomates group bacterium GW2011_GWC2_45_8]